MSRGGCSRTRHDEENLTINIWKLC
eukprot:gene27208-biopygen17746